MHFRRVARFRGRTFYKTSLENARIVPVGMLWPRDLFSRAAAAAY
jgi:hypothetical protein